MNDDLEVNRLLASQLDKFDLSVDEPPTAEQWRLFLDELDGVYERASENTLILDENFDNLISHAVDAFVLHDTKGHIIEANQAACEMLGYTREEFLSLHVSDFEMALDPGAFWDDMTVDEVFTVEGTHRRKDGSIYPVETRVGAFVVDGQKVILALCRDISKRKAAEEQLKALNARLESARDEAIQASQAKSTFLANMSHELRTPLNAVIGYSEFLIEEMEDVGDEDYIPDLDRILTAGRHLLALINDILDLSKIEAGKTELDITEFDLEQMVGDIESTAQPLADKNDNELVVQVVGEPPPMRSDVTKIRQILFNLLSNACKFTSEGQVRLRVTCDGDYFGFEVSDTGVGMSDEELDRVFEAFQQADASTTRKFGGTGLGLAITKHYSHMLGGSIDVSSEQGQGTTFRVVLPVDFEEREVEVDESAHTDALPSPRADSSGIVLVIEDDESARDLLSRTLRGEGYKVVTATNGAEGLHLARELDPLAITLDVLMPETDGWGVLGELEADEKLRRIPVILISMLDERQRGFALGADHYLVKPIDRSRLVDLIGEYRRRGRATGHCLVVEDDEATRELVRRIVEQQGWQVSEATNGQEGLDAAAQSLPDLVLLDLMMPEVDGFEFLSRFRADARFAAVPVVVVTAKELTSEEADELEAAASQVIQKVSRGPGELLAEVRRVLRKLG
ncbi:response regulator [Persicimonas caeni]|uniref:histidine kinase n=1 Tax=Persicimonas caeni TaxID=2292766 RepID=A0A4Y6PUH8_PERCE|nr:response regulator [Persicimonas caeni]QDG51900.1 response regulator [Persicimonas caeni]QED33121.1 response regulator [Persicimonas caeni]